MPWGDEQIAVCMVAQAGRLRFAGRHHPAHSVLSRGLLCPAWQYSRICYGDSLTITLISKYQ